MKNAISFSESTSDPSRLNDKLIAYLDAPELESPSDKKKTNVRFNEMVERIEVISDDDNLKDVTASPFDEDSRL